MLQALAVQLEKDLTIFLEIFLEISLEVVTHSVEDRGLTKALTYNIQ